MAGHIRWSEPLDHGEDHFCIYLEMKEKPEGVLFRKTHSFIHLLRKHSLNPRYVSGIVLKCGDRVANKTEVALASWSSVKESQTL